MTSFQSIADQLPGGLRWKYEVVLRGGGRPEHYWSVANEAGAVHISAWRPSSPAFGREWMGGIEIHSPKPLYEGGSDKPDHERCWLLDGPCWHDGTSLGFSETVAPYLHDTDAMGLSDHALTLDTLLSWHRRYFPASADGSPEGGDGEAGSIAEGDDRAVGASAPRRPTSIPNPPQEESPT